MIYKIKLHKIFSGLLLLLSLTACQVDSKIQGYLGSVSGKDFQNTQIINSGPTVADGSTPLLVAVHLKHSNNQPEPNYLPTYSMSTTAGVTALPCTTSDANGVSSCIIKSISPGTKTLTLTNAKVGLFDNLVFTGPTGSQRLSVVSGGLVNATTPNGSRVDVTLGQAVKGIKHETAGGYKVIMSTQGVIQ